MAANINRFGWGGRLGHTEFAQGHVTFNAMMIDRYRERLGKFAICSFTVNKPATYEINYLCTTRTHNIYILYIAQTTFYDNDTNTPQPRMYTDIYLTNTHTPERIECTFAHFDSYINSITSVQCEIVWKMNGVRSPYKYIPTEKKKQITYKCEHVMPHHHHHHQHQSVAHNST